MLDSYETVNPASSLPELKSTLISRNITVDGRRTSVRLEPEIWMALREIASRETCSIHDVCTLVSMRKKPGASLTASIRAFLMLYFRAAATEEGHQKAGHGNFQRMLQRARLPAEKAALISRNKNREDDEIRI